MKGNLHERLRQRSGNARSTPSVVEDAKKPAKQQQLHQMREQLDIPADLWDTLIKSGTGDGQDRMDPNEE